MRSTTLDVSDVNDKGESMKTTDPHIKKFSSDFYADINTMFIKPKMQPRLEDELSEAGSKNEKESLCHQQDTQPGL